MKKVTAIILLSLIIISSTGCWSRKETETLAITTAIAVDRVEIGGKKMYRLSEHILLPRQLGLGVGRSGGGGTGTQRASWIASSLGQTLEEAARNLSTRVPRTMFFADTRVIIFGEKISREGLEEALDFLTRYKEFRERSLILITRGEADNAILAKPEMEKELAHEVFGIQTFGQVQTPKVGEMNLKEFGERIITPGIDAWAPVFEISPPPEKPKPQESPDKTARISGMAMFRTGKLVGWLGDRESQAVTIISHKARRGDITVNVGGKSTVSCVFRNPKVKTKAIISGNNIKVDIRVKLEINTVESSPYPITTPEGIKAVEKAVNTEVEDEIRSALKKSQAVGADIMGVGRTVEITKHLFWHQIQDRWSQIYPQVSFQVKVESKIGSTGMRNKAFNGKLFSR